MFPLASLLDLIHLHDSWAPTLRSLDSIVHPQHQILPSLSGHTTTEHRFRFGCAVHPGTLCNCPPASSQDNIPSAWGSSPPALYLYFFILFRILTTRYRVIPLAPSSNGLDFIRTLWSVNLGGSTLHCMAHSLTELPKFYFYTRQAVIHMICPV